MTNTENRPAGYMSCPRECGTDVREHNSSGLVAGKCDTDSNPAMRRADMADWFTLRGVQPSDLPALLDEYEGWTENAMDAMYESLHGPMA